MSKLIDMTNQRFGKLMVLYRNGTTQSGVAIWHCKCDCGNECDVRGDKLRGKYTQSCGCLQKETTHNIFVSDITNQRFGKLIALYPIKQKYGIFWHCKCDCGGECDVYGSSLRRGATQSCGCIISIGEEKIASIFNDNNIYYEKQKIFDSCRFPDTNMPARFDFYIENKYLLEYDGLGHYINSNENNPGWNTKESVEKTQLRDNYKNKWCKDNNIPLIRIPYTQLAYLTLDDLLLERSKFICQ